MLCAFCHFVFFVVNRFSRFGFCITDGSREFFRDFEN